MCNVEYTKIDNCNIVQYADSTNTELERHVHSFSSDYVYYFTIWYKVRSHPLLLLKISIKAVSATVGSKHMREHGHILVSYRWIWYMVGWNFSMLISRYFKIKNIYICWKDSLWRGFIANMKTERLKMLLALVTILVPKPEIH